MFSPYVAYLRVSTNKQATEGCSLETQRSLCLDWIEKDARKAHDNLTLSYALYDGRGVLVDGEARPFPESPDNELHVPIYQDDGVSGSVDIEKSPALERALAQVPDGGKLVVLRLDRLSRNDFRSALVRRVLKKRNAVVRSTVGEGTDDDSPQAKFLTDIMEAAARLERRQTKARIRETLRQLREDGKVTGQIPRGFALCPDEIHIEARVISEWDVLQKIKQLVNDGNTPNEVADRLKRLNGGYRDRNGRFLTTERIVEILTNTEPDVPRVAPFGYCRNVEGDGFDSRTVLDSALAPVVLELWARGLSYEEIAGQLREIPGMRTTYGNFLTKGQVYGIVKAQRRKG